jgi:uncharacterized protein YbjT (DUF2867 family)
MKIVVIGGTGLIGSKVVSKLTQLEHDALAAAPNTGVNTITGEGLAEALEGAQVVVDLANSPSFEDQAAMDFFRTAGKNLIEAEKAAGVQLHVALSVVGTERLQDSGYFRAKLAQETLIKSAPIPYTLVRATQFMEFLRSIAQLATEGNTVRLSHAFIQPMAARMLQPQWSKQRLRRQRTVRSKLADRRSSASTNWSLASSNMTRIRARSSSIRTRATPAPN